MTGGEIATIVSGIVAAILTGGVAKALIDYYRDRKKVPLEQDSLAVANAKELIGLAGTITDSLHTEMERMQKRMDAELDDMREDLKEARARLDQAEKDLAAERAQRIALSRRTDGLEGTLSHAEDYIRRTWANIRLRHPEAWVDCTPVPGFMTDPGFPAVLRTPSPPDDGQPENLTDPHTLEGHP